MKFSILPSMYWALFLLTLCQASVFLFDSTAVANGAKPYGELCLQLLSPTQDLTWSYLLPEAREDLRVLLDNLDQNTWMGNAYRDWLTQSPSGIQERFFAQFYFEQALKMDERIQLLAGYTKLKAEGLLGIIDRIVWAGGAGGVIVFRPRMSPASVRKTLAAKGHIEKHGASRGLEWGLRSAKGGAQLHFRGEGDQVSVHLDLNNPAEQASCCALAKHVIMDSNLRKFTHSAYRVVEKLKKQGLKLPIFGE